MKYLYILLIGSILLFEACGSKTHTYYNDKNGFTFSVVEQENNDVLIGCESAYKKCLREE